MNEAVVQQQVRLELARRGAMVWRNNSGACFDDTGRLIRYGLGNDSEKINKEIKSSDLIGIVPRIVTAEMVGSIVGFFTAIECKAKGWKPSPSNERERAQRRFHEVVKEYGGVAAFVSDPLEIQTLLGQI